MLNQRCICLYGYYVCLCGVSGYLSTSFQLNEPQLKNQCFLDSYPYHHVSVFRENRLVLDIQGWLIDSLGLICLSTSLVIPRRSVQLHYLPGSSIPDFHPFSPSQGLLSQVGICRSDFTKTLFKVTLNIHSGHYYDRDIYNFLYLVHDAVFNNCPVTRNTTTAHLNYVSGLPILG